MRYSPLLPQAKSHGNRKVIRDFQRKYEKKKGRLGVWKFSSEVEAMDAPWGERFPGVLVGEGVDEHSSNIHPFLQHWHHF